MAQTRIQGSAADFVPRASPKFFAQRLAEDKIYHIMDNVFMGGFVASINRKELERHNIRDVISLTSSQDCGLQHRINDQCRPEGTACLSYPSWDTPDCELFKDFKNIGDFIHRSYQAGRNVLVSSLDGRGRAPGIVIGYLLQKYQLHPEKAFSAEKAFSLPKKKLGDCMYPLPEKISALPCFLQILAWAAKRYPLDGRCSGASLNLAQLDVREGKQKGEDNCTRAWVEFMLQERAEMS